MPRPGRARRRQRSVCRSRTATQHGRDARVERVIDLLRGNEVDVAVKATRGQDFALTRNRLGRRSDDDIDTRLRIGIAGFADLLDAPVFEPHVRLIDTRVVYDERVGDNGVHRTACPRDLRLPHPVSDDLASAELHLFAISGVVSLDFDEEFGVCKTHLVARGGAKHGSITGSGDGCGHFANLRSVSYRASQGAECWRAYDCDRV